MTSFGNTIFPFAHDTGNDDATNYFDYDDVIGGKKHKHDHKSKHNKKKTILIVVVVAIIAVALIIGIVLIIIIVIRSKKIKALNASILSAMN